MAEGADFSKFIEPVAIAMLQASHGEPNRALSTPGRELRFGKKGALSVDLQAGVWHDHEAGEGGGTLDLLKLYGGMDRPEALEWLERQGFIAKREAKGAAPKSGEKFLGFMDRHPIATFDYRDDKGQLAYQIWKFEKGGEGPPYMQARPAPNSGCWIVGLQDGTYGRVKSGHWFRAKEGKSYEEERHFPEAERWLYRRDEVLKAIAKGEPVVLVEGEKDVETIRSWGMVATTNAGGAKFWRDSFNEDLRGADLVICGDNDDAGRQRTLLRGAELRGFAKRVRVLDIALHWPDIPTKGDVSDWKSDGGGTAEKFADLVTKAPLWRPETPPSKFGAISWADLDAKAPEFAYLVDGWIPLDGRSVMGGPSQAGKSFLALHLSLCVARGVPFLGNPVERRGVIYQAGEGGSGAKKRVLAYREHYQVSPQDDVPFVFLPAKVDLFSKDGDTAALIEEIKAHALMLSHPLGLVVIDTLATATAGADENSGKDMSVVLANIAKIERECKAHVMLVHHMNAEGKKLRGHTSIFADVDTVITILNDDQTKVRTATLSKQKDDETGVKLHFELMSVPVGHNAKLDKPITSCVVLPKGEKDILKKEQERQGFNVNPTERAVMLNIFDATRLYGRLVASELDGPAAAIGKQVIKWSHYSDLMLSKMVSVSEEDSEGMNREKDRIRKEFDRAKTMLIKGGVIGVDRPYMWWTGKPVRGFPHSFPKRDPAEQVWRDKLPPAEAYTSPGLEEVLNEPEIPF